MINTETAAEFITQLLFLYFYLIYRSGLLTP